MRFLGVLVALVIAAPVLGQGIGSEGGRVRVETMITGLSQPWALGHLPGGGVLITERDGRLLLLQNGQLHAVSGAPQVAARGQGGLLDVMIPRDFATSREVFLSYAKPQARGAGTALAVGTLSASGLELQNTKDIFESAPGFTGGRHFGSRIVEARDGTVFLTTGDRGDRPSAQDRSNHNGAVIRINRDGSVPEDNPFVGQPNMRPEIWSYGHRNPQGAALDLQGGLWTAEHGARGGDEVNRVRKGANFGWPVISYGRHYSGQKIGEGTARDGMEQPAFYWDPSMAPSGMMIYSGALWPDWRGDIFVGSLKFDYIARLSGTPLREVEQLSSAATTRVRDIVEAPDGSIWFIAVGEGAVYRLTPG